MIRSFFFLLFSLVPLLSIFVLQGPKPIDLYELLEVAKNASHHDISKAFHTLSLKCHQINNAYEILSDKDRKNYGLYGDEKSSPNLDGGNYGDCGGSGQGYSKSSFSSSGTIKAINSDFFKKDILEQGMTWLLLVYSPFVKEYDILESIVEEVANSLQGAIEVGSINCQNEQTFCEDLELLPRPLAQSFKAYRLEFVGSSSTKGNLPQLLLLSAKKDTPVLWRGLSCLYRNRFHFFDAEVHDISDPLLRKLLGVNTLPAVIGWLSIGEMRVLSAGILKELKTGIRELNAFLDTFEEKKKEASDLENWPWHYGLEHRYKTPLLTGSNFESMCNDSVVVCIIGIFRSSIMMETLEYYALDSILYLLSKDYSGDAISFSLLDASKHTAFLYTFSSAGFQNSAMLIVAYKPREETFAILIYELTFEDVEEFISSVLVGDIQFKKVLQKPIIE
ncbi:hypothetical protein MRB53_003616 [Persea americana]|uniref:Uncharacterized protein n=1 Tax=Persea americana TaxID=3435 RepID=A0ACC2MYS4_PERAE|nr:hypothetical protein MRB53_003616 [Persea americana]